MLGSPEPLPCAQYLTTSITWHACQDYMHSTHKYRSADKSIMTNTLTSLCTQPVQTTYIETSAVL